MNSYKTKQHKTRRFPFRKRLILCKPSIIFPATSYRFFLSFFFFRYRTQEIFRGQEMIKELVQPEELFTQLNFSSRNFLSFFLSYSLSFFLSFFLSFLLYFVFVECLWNLDMARKVNYDKNCLWTLIDEVAQSGPALKKKKLDDFDRLNFLGSVIFWLIIICDEMKIFYNTFLKLTKKSTYCLGNKFS